MTDKQATAGIILAAGKGTRMKSELPKCLHKICGLPLVEHVSRAMRSAGLERIVLVVGHGGELMQEALGSAFEYAWQREQLGTGHAAMQAAATLEGHCGTVLVAQGDTPLLSAELLADLLKRHRKAGAACTLATALLADPSGYGRIVRGATGGVERIVEQKDATADERTIHEVNAGVYAFEAPVLFDTLPKLSKANAQGEYYLTDAIKTIWEEGLPVDAIVYEDPGLLIGVNDRWQLAEADALMRTRILRRLALDGVTIVDPGEVYIDADVRVGRDTLIEPGTHLRGRTTVGERCWIGPYTHILDCQVEDGCNVLMSHLKGAKIGKGSRVGPFANIRPGTVLGERCKVGNFVEVKNAQLGPGVSASHLSYLGDASVGDDTNIGAGTITCNYDGFAKHRTEIGGDVFVGSNSTIVAPVTIGEGAMVAAGSVVTKDVPPDALAVGRARQENKESWVRQWRNRKNKSR